MKPEPWKLYLISTSWDISLATVVKTQIKDYVIYCQEDDGRLTKAYDNIEVNSFASQENGDSNILSIQPIPRPDFTKMLLKINDSIVNRKCFTDHDQRLAYEVAFVFWVDAHPELRKLLKVEE